MKIGVDIRDLRLARTGQKTMMEELCRQFRLLETESLRFYFFDVAIPVYTGRNKFMLIMEHARQLCWKQVILPVKAWLKGCDVIFCNDYVVPYVHLGFTTVQVFHDAFFFEYPEHYNPIWLMMFRNLAIPAAKRSAYIIAPTQYARKTIHQHSGIALEKIIPIYEGPKTLATPGTTTDITGLSLTEGEKYILHVGVFEKRKNLPRLILAYKQLKETHAGIKLVLVGQGSGTANSDDTVNIQQTIHDNGLEKDVLLPGYVSDSELAAIYQHAFVYVFPSVNEGFGIPILEAFRFGLPVIAANNTCLPEVGGDAILTFDPFDVQDICRQLQRVVEDDTLRSGLIESGKKRLALFSWKKTAEEIITVFAKACGRNAH